MCNGYARTVVRALKKATRVFTTLELSDIPVWFSGVGYTSLTVRKSAFSFSVCVHDGNATNDSRFDLRFIDFPAKTVCTRIDRRRCAYLLTALRGIIEKTHSKKKKRTTIWAVGLKKKMNV